MKKQNGLILLEVLIAVVIVGMLILYMARIQNKQLKHEIETLTAAKIANLYQLSTQVIFEPLVMDNDSQTNDISTWNVNDTIKKLQKEVLDPIRDDIIYLDIKTEGAERTAEFFNGIDGSCDTDHHVGVKNVRVECSSGLNFNGSVVKGVMISGINQSYFSVNHVSNTDINQVRPTKLTIFLDGINDRTRLKEMNDLAEAVSTQVSLNNGAYAQIHIADFNAVSPSLYDTEIIAYEALLDPSLYSIANNMGLAIVFDVRGTQESQGLRNDGMVAMQANRSLCWDVSTETEAICQSAIVSDDTSSDGLSGSGEPSRFIKTNGNLLYQTENQETSEKVYRTPIEPIVAFFESGSSIQISKPVCPTIREGADLLELQPHLSVVPSSFTNSGYGNFPDINRDDYGSNEVTNADNVAQVLSGILFNWKDEDTYWEVSSNIASPYDDEPTSGLNLGSIQILALRWCERDI